MHLKRELKEETPVYQIFFIVFKRIFMHLKRELKDFVGGVVYVSRYGLHASKKRIERRDLGDKNNAEYALSCI